MTKTVQTYRCVMGDFPPNKITYMQPISSRRLGTWIGHCKGDKLHPEHLVMIKNQQDWFIKYSKTNIFATRWEDINKITSIRLFPRQKKLRCPVGKVPMNLQRKYTDQINLKNTEIYKCTGNFQGKGHKEHLVRIQHGALEVKINKKEMGVLIVTIQSE
jgi:hypothetical protein